MQMKNILFWFPSILSNLMFIIRFRIINLRACLSTNNKEKQNLNEIVFLYDAHNV